MKKQAPQTVADFHDTLLMRMNGMCGSKAAIVYDSRRCFIVVLFPYSQINASHALIPLRYHTP